MPAPCAPGAPSARRASRSRAGRGTRRTARAWRRCRSARSARRRSGPATPTTAPAITSEWPDRYFVRRLHDEVRAVLERAADRGRGERVVDRQQRAVAVGDLGERRQVRDDARRVGDGLDVEDPRRAARPARPRPPRRRSCPRTRRRRRAGRTPRSPGSGSCRSRTWPMRSRSPARSSDRNVAWIAAIPVARAMPASAPWSSATASPSAIDRRVVDPAVGVARLLAREDRGQLLGVARRRTWRSGRSGRTSASGATTGTREAARIARVEGPGRVARSSPADATPGGRRPAAAPRDTRASRGPSPGPRSRGLARRASTVHRLVGPLEQVVDGLAVVRDR